MKHRFSLAVLIFISFTALPQKQEWYELRKYSFNKPEQEIVDNFLKDAYLPAMHRLGFKNIGAFKPVETDSTYGKIIYVLVAYPSIQKFTENQSNLNKDKEYLEKGKLYLDATYNSSPIKRIESVLMIAFSKAPFMQIPKLSSPRKDRIYELRSYEGPTEKKNENKIAMFNDGDEIGLFQSLGFNAVFYGEVKVGAHMPNLMYMTTFESMQARDEHWKAFFASPQWEKLKSDSKYQNNVSHADIMLLRPTEDSDY